MATKTATRDFTDNGTGKSFKQGQPVDADDGSIENYVAAGLVSVTTDAQAIVDDSHTAGYVG